MFEAYRIGVTLSLTNHVSHGLALMVRDFAATDAQASMLQKRIKSIQTDALKGGLMLGAGVGILALFKAPLDEAKRFEQQYTKFKLFGLTDAQNAEAVKFVRTMDTLGTSYVDNMRMMTEAQGVFRESGLLGEKALEGAKIAAPVLAKIQFATAALDDESKAKMHTQSLAMLRFIEMRGGLKDAPTFNAIADAGWKAIQSSGGNVNWEQLRQFMARGGVAAQGLSDTTLFAKLEPIISELKGSTAGNAWMTSYNRLVGGVRIPNQVAHMLAENGIWDAKRIEWNSQGGIKRFDGNPLKDMATFSRDPVEFYEKNILPMYARMNGGKGLDVSERARENTMLFGRTGGAMFSLIDRQLATIHRSVGAWEKALGADASAKLAGTTLAGKEVDLHAKWAKVLNDLGNTVLPYAISGVEKLTGALRWFDGWINRNETAVKWLSGALAVLAGGLMMRGSVLLLSAAFRGLGLAMMFQAAGGVKTLMTGIAGLASPIGIAVLALGTLAAAAYAFRPFTKNEVDAQRRDGAHLTSGAKERMKALGWASEEKLTQDAVRLKNLKDSSIGSNIATHGAVLGITHYLADRARLAFGTPSAVAAGQQRPVVVRAGGNDRPAAAPAPYAASKPQPVQVVSNTYLDGRLISQNVVERMVQESMRPAGGLSGVDPRMSFASPSMAR